MADIVATFGGSMPEAYEKYLVPFLFSAPAADLAGRAAGLNPARVLEIACGTGIVTRRLREALPEASLTATDLSDGMVETARATLADLDGIDYRAADGCDLPFADAAFDLVACQFGVMFYPDKVGGYREAHRVLAPGGAFLFNVWDSFEHNAVPRIADQVVASFFDADPPKFYKTPFGYHDTGRIAADLEQAGFTDIEHAVVRRDAESPSARTLAHGLVHGNPVSSEIAVRGTADPAHVVDALAAALAAEAGDAPLRAPIQALVFSARKG